MEMESLKAFGQWLLILLFGAFLIACPYVAIFGMGSGRYRISQGAGKHESAYRTDKYKVLPDGCVVFVCVGDSMRVCGTYRIR